MSRFDPPAPRFDPPASVPPPPMHHQNVQIDQENEIPKTGNETGNPNAPATVQRCKNANLIRSVALGLRGLSLLFSFLCFVIIATINGFNKLDPYNYVFAVALVSFIYNAVQTAKGVSVLVTRREWISQERLSAMIDFIGDQVITYMLMSGSSVGLALANNERQQIAGSTNLALNQLASKSEGGASMLFFAFLALVYPTLFSGYKLSQAFMASCSKPLTN